MSKRRKVGDTVRKKPNAGFIGEELVIRLIQSESNLTRLKYPDYCILECGDNGCIEWANVEIIEEKKVIGYCYHISECEMEDL